MSDDEREPDAAVALEEARAVAAIRGLGDAEVELIAFVPPARPRAGWSVARARGRYRTELIVTAFSTRGARRSIGVPLEHAEALASEKMMAITGGIKIPGLT